MLSLMFSARIDAVTAGVAAPVIGAAPSVLQETGAA